MILPNALSQNFCAGANINVDLRSLYVHLLKNIGKENGFEHKRCGHSSEGDISESNSEDDDTINYSVE